MRWYQRKILNVKTYMAFITFYSATTQEELESISQLKKDEIYTLTLLFTKEPYYQDCIRKLEEKKMKVSEVEEGTYKLEIYDLEFYDQELLHRRFTLKFGDNILIQIHRHQKSGDRIAFLYSSENIKAVVET